MMSLSLGHRDAGIVALESTSLIILNVVSLLGNTAICLAVYRNKQLRTITNLYIIALAICDLTSAVIVMPSSSVVLVKGEWIFGDVFCNLQGFFVVMNIYASPCLMTLTAINRYVRICRAGIYHKLFSKRKSMLWIFAVYATVTAYIVTQVLVGNQKIQFVSGYAVCSTTHLGETAKLIHYSIIVPAFVVGPIILTTLCYYKVFRCIRRHNKDFATSLRTGSSAALSISRRELRVSISLFVVVIVFAFCWIPLWILALLFRFQLVDSLSRHVTLFIMFLVFISSTVNPFIYAGMNTSFRREFGRIANFCSPPSEQESSSFQLGQLKKTTDEEQRNKSVCSEEPNAV